MIRVVIVDDDPMVASINRRYTEQFSDLTVEAVFQAGDAALAHIRRTAPELVILDIYMPFLDGLSLLEAIRREEIDTDVIMVTAANEMEQVDKALRLGIVDYLIKPFAFERFSLAIGKFLAKRNLLAGPGPLNQQMVDRLTAIQPAAGGGADLRKGISQDTRRLIGQYLQEHRDTSHTCEDIAQAVKLSKVTVRRYLNHMLETGEITSAIRYETGGRPGILYQYNG